MSTLYTIFSSTAYPLKSLWNKHLILFVHYPDLLMSSKYSISLYYCFTTNSYYPSALTPITSYFL